MTQQAVCGNRTVFREGLLLEDERPFSRSGAHALSVHHVQEGRPCSGMHEAPSFGNEGCFPAHGPYAVRASPRIEAIHHHMVEARAIAAGHDLHSSKAVALEKALRTLCGIGADQPGRRLLGRDVIDAMLNQRAANAMPM